MTQHFKNTAAANLTGAIRLDIGQGQYEAENLGSEARKGMVEKLEQGHWTFRAPDGYINLREFVDGRKIRAWIATNRPRAAIIRLIFRWYGLGNQSLRLVAERLNSLHMKRVEQHKSGCLRRSGKPWDEQAIHKILSNRFYIEELRVPAWDMIRQGKHPIFIRPTDFQRVQEIMCQQGLLRGQVHEYLLKGMIFLNSDPPQSIYATHIAILPRL